MTKTKGKQEQSTEFIKIVSKRLRKAISTLELTYTDIVDKCEENNYRITKSALSKMLNESNPSGYTLAHVAQIAAALNLDLNQLLSTDEADDIRIPSSYKETFVSNKEAPSLQKYIGHYNLLTYRTISEETGPIKGTLDIKSSPSSPDLAVHIKINVDRNYTKNSAITKEYHGSLRLSTKMRAIYITCSNEEICEDIFIIFPYIVLDYENLYSRIGMALVSSSGVNRVPTALRMMITANKLTPQQEKVAFAQLLMNRADIRISVDQFQKMLNDESLPSAFKESFVTNNELAGAIKRTYYHINEATIRNSEMSLFDRMMSVSLLRYYSDAPKYAKVSSKANELTYRLLKELDPSSDSDQESDNS